MENFNSKIHWENIYTSKELTDVSWYQSVPETSLKFLKQANLPMSAKIIDVGGGDSLLVDHLLDAGYTDITVLDISEIALERAKSRLGKKASMVKWIVSDASTFSPVETYDFWHDRAVFHFLTAEKDITNYMKVLSHGVRAGGMLVMGTFSESGPTKCSGIPIKQYSETSMTDRLKAAFEKIRCLTVDHQTPFDTIQNFIFCSFTRKSALG
jgi:ubiquinone/menaquinone biosynthesis C-methylase UbiE